MSFCQKQKPHGILFLYPGSVLDVFRCDHEFFRIFPFGRGIFQYSDRIIAAVAGIMSALLQPVLAGYADRPDSPSLKKIIQILYVIQLLLGIGLFFSRTLILTGLLYGISIALLQLMTPFINALGMESINQGQKLNFGLARGMGSVAYAVICYVLGIITVKAGVLSIPASVTIITVLSLGCLIIFPFVKTQKSAQTSSDSKSLANPLLFFRKYRRFFTGTDWLYFYLPQSCAPE